MIGLLPDRHPRPVKVAGDVQRAGARPSVVQARPHRPAGMDYSTQQALNGSAPLTSAMVVQLQATAGNAAVDALLHRGQIVRPVAGTPGGIVAQRSIWSRITGAASSAVRGVGHAASAAWSGVTRGASAAWTGVKRGVSAAWSGAQRAASAALGGISRIAAGFWAGATALGSGVLHWLEAAGHSVWRAIEWFGGRALAVLKAIGTVAFEKLSLLGALAWSFISNLPERFWRLLVDGWHAVVGVLSWLGSGLMGLAGAAWDAVKGVFSWLKSGVSGALTWIGRGLAGGAAWAVDFIGGPSLDKLRDGMLGALSWVWSGIKGFAAWGWNGVVAAAKWAWSKIKAFAAWLWDGVIHGLVWLGKVVLHLLELVGAGEALQLVWGLLFRMRKLTGAEQKASESVHPVGLIPYWQIRVDDDSVLIKIGTTLAGLFKTKISPGAITTMHIIHAPAGGLSLDVMVHELTHVAQYELVGAVYIPEALHAQGSAAGYDYVFPYLTLTEARKAGQTFAGLNREQQASLCEDYYRLSNGMAAHYGASLAELAPFVAEMRARKF